MKRAHLFRVEASPESFKEFVRSAREVGVRVGWLDLRGAQGPPDLESAASLGVLRAVAVGDQRTVSVKPRTGPAVLGDLEREHFLGCGVILTRGDVEAPLLAPAGASRPDVDWALRLADGTVKYWSTPMLVARLRSPRSLAGRTASGC